MRPLTHTLLSALSFIFALWAIWASYKIWNGTWQSTGLSLSFLTTIILVLSCTWFVATAIRNAAETIGRKANINHLIQHYEALLGNYQQQLFAANPGNPEAQDRLKISIALQAGPDVLNAINEIDELLPKNASLAEKEKAFAKLVLMIRRETGHYNYNVPKVLETLVQSGNT